MDGSSMADGTIIDRSVNFRGEDGKSLELGDGETDDDDKSNSEEGKSRYVPQPLLFPSHSFCPWEEKLSGRTRSGIEAFYLNCFSNTDFVDRARLNLRQRRGQLP